jgi:hypothetical protein
LAIPGALLKQLKLGSQRTVHSADHKRITRWGKAEFNVIQREIVNEWIRHDQTDRWFNLSLE